MKRRPTSRVAIALALAWIPLLIGCGSNNSAPPNGLPPIGTIPGGSYPGYPGYNGTCVPITAPITFSGGGVYMDSASIRGGTIPPIPTVPYAGQSFGQVFVGTTAVAIPVPVPPSPYGSPGYVNATFTKNAVDANVTLTVNSGAVAAGTPYPGTATVTGTITINPQDYSYIYLLAANYGGVGSVPFPTTPYSYGYPPSGYPPNGYPATGNACVSGVAFDTGYTLQGYGSGPTLYSGTFYLYLNGTQHGWQFPI